MIESDAKSRVVAASCNPVEVTRREWERVAEDSDARYINIEVICSDAREHERGVESRLCTVPGLNLPTWEQVVERRCEEWTASRLVLDTFGRGESESLARMPQKVGALDRSPGAISSSGLIAAAALRFAAAAYLNQPISSRATISCPARFGWLPCDMNVDISAPASAAITKVWRLSTRPT